MKCGWSTKASPRKLCCAHCGRWYHMGCASLVDKAAFSFGVGWRCVSCAQVMALGLVAPGPTGTGLAQGRVVGLLQQADVTRDMSLRESTNERYSKLMKLVQRAGDDLQVSFLPCDNVRGMLLFEHLRERACGWPTIRQVRSAIVSTHAAYGWVPPFDASFGKYWVGLETRLGHVVKQKPALPWSMLVVLVERMGKSAELIDGRDLAVALIVVFGLRRLSEIVGNKSGRLGLRRADVKVLEDRVVVHVRAAKNFRHGKTADVCISRVNSCGIDVGSVLLRYLSSSEVSEFALDEPLFQPVGRRGKFLGTGNFRRRLKRILGLWWSPEVATLYSSYSLRRCGVDRLKESGVSTNDIKKYGCWESDAVEVYVGRTPSSMMRCSTLF